MADLGAVGDGRSHQATNPLDVYMARDISLNAVGGRHQIEPSFAVDPQDRKSVRGTVLDENGDPLARTVLCIKQGSQEIVDSTTSDATTGAFELRPPDAAAVTVVAMPEPGDNRNAVVLYNLTPVDPL
jgi:hypothetical protein